MPKTWYVKAANRVNDDDSEEIIAKKQFYQRICSDKKPYFFMYNYSSLKTEYDNYVKESDRCTKIIFGKTVQELLKSEELTAEEAEYIENFYKFAPLYSCLGTINRICWSIEEEFDNIPPVKDEKFDLSVLKSGHGYSKSNFKAVKQIYEEYKKKSKEITLEEENMAPIQSAIAYFKEQCDILGMNQDELCDIVIDLCYSSNNSKQFAWDICGEQIVQNLLERHNNRLAYPERCEDGDILFKGEKFRMVIQEVNQ